MSIKLKPGCPAYIDSYNGLVPCIVHRIFTNDGSSIVQAEVRITAEKGTYKLGETVQRSVLFVVPREAVVFRRDGAHILPYDVEALT